MTIESDLFDTLDGLVGSRCYPDEAPSGATAPYIVYQQTGGEAQVYLENTLPSKKNGRFQVAVWSATRLEAASLALQAETALCAATAFQASPLGAAVADVDADTNLRGSRQDFSVWSTR